MFFACAGNFQYAPPVFYDGLTGGANVFFSPYNGPVLYNTPILPVNESTLQEYIKKQMYVSFVSLLL